MKTVNILGVPIATVNMDQAVTQIDECIQSDQKAYVTVTGVHGVMESHYNERVKYIHQSASMCVLDGMPMVWIGKIYGHKNIRQVCGRELMLEMMKRSLKRGYIHFFYGGKQGMPELLRDCLVKRFPSLKAVGIYFPPFRQMTLLKKRNFSN